MIIIVNYLSAIKRPFTDFRKLVVGIIFNLPIPLLSFVSFGYILNSGKASYEGNDKMPEWKNYGRLWLTGLKGNVIALIYCLPIIILLFLFAKNLLRDYINDEITFTVNFIQNPTDLINNYGFVIIFIFIVSSFIRYLVPIAMMNFIISEKFRTAFDFRSIFRRVFTKNYFSPWIILTLMYIGTGFIINFITLKLFPINILEDISSLNFSGVNFGMLIISIITYSFIEFVGMLFAYTIYGNVLSELKK